MGLAFKCDRCKCLGEGKARIPDISALMSQLSGDVYIVRFKMTINQSSEVGPQLCDGCILAVCEEAIEIGRANG